MPLKIIYGNNVETVTNAILQDVRRHSDLWPNQRGLIIVRENRKVLIERSYLLEQQADQLMMAEVLSFNRLAMRLLSEVGLFNDLTVNKELSAMIIRRIMYENAETLTYYGGLRYNRYFVQELSNIIDELNNHNIDFETLENIKIDDENLRKKMADLALIGCAYKKFLQRHDLSDPHTWLEKLRQLLNYLLDIRELSSFVEANLNTLKFFKQSETLFLACKRLASRLADTQLWLTGFAEYGNFTPIEYDIVTSLIRLCRSTTLSAVFSHADQETNLARLLASDFTVASGASKVIKGLIERLPNEQVEHEAYFSSVELSDQRQIFWQAETHEIELRAAAGEIARLVEEEGYRYRDVSVILNRSDFKNREVRQIFALADVPVFLNLEGEMLRESVPRIILGALQIIRNGWQVDDVLTYLRNRLVCPDAVKVDLLETFWLKRGLRYKNIWEDERYDSLEDQSTSFLMLWRDQYLTPILKLEESIAPLRSCDEFAEKILVFMQELDLENKVNDLLDAYQSAGQESEAELLAKSWNGIYKILCMLIQTGADIELDLEAFYQIILSGIDRMQSEVVPSLLDQVMVGSSVQMIGNPCKVLFILGMDQDSFPSSGVKESLIKDLDRQQINKMLSIELPDIRENQMVRNRFIVSQFIDQPRERTYFSLNGHLKPSYIYRTLYTGRTDCQYLAAFIQTLDDPRLYIPDEARHFIVAVNRGEINLEWTEDAAKFLNTDAAKQWKKIIKRTYLLDPEAFEQALSKEPIPDLGQCRSVKIPEVILKSHHDLMSVSRLERYAGCPYAYYVDYVLGAKERDMGEPTPLNTGILNHKVLEMAFMKLVQDPSFVKMSEIAQNDLSQLMDWVQTSIDQEIENNFDLKSYQQFHIRCGEIRDLTNRLANTIFGSVNNLRKGTKTSYMEWSFGADGVAPLVFPMTQGTLKLRGNIDRIDVFEDENMTAQFQVIDYKTSKRIPDVERILAGLDFQLPIYLQAWHEIHPEQQPTDAVYIGLNAAREKVSQEASRFNITGPMSKERAQMWLIKSYNGQSLVDKIDEFSKKIPITLDDLLTVAQEAAVQRATALRAGHFDVHPTRLLNTRGSLQKPPCEYCANKGICRIENEHWQAIVLKSSDVIHMNTSCDTEEEDHG